GNDINQALLAANSDVDEYYVFDGLWSVYKKVRAGRFDAAVIVAPDMVSGALAYLAGVPCIVVPEIVGGASPLETLWHKLFRRIARPIVIPHRMHHYAPGEYLRLLAPFGIEATDTSKHLAYSEAARKKAKELLSRREGISYVGIFPSSGDKIKNWGSANFAALANLLAERLSVRIVIFGSSRDREEVGKMIEALRADYLDLSEKLSIDELKAVIAALDLFVASDTGPVYIAEAFNVPTVDILGPVDEREQAPRGARHERVVPPGHRTPQMFVMNTDGYDLVELRRQIDSITPQMVLAACERLLANRT
ncbi:glycosyltransferase family 9 protein, partial [Candidatus Parcubacteria bacterium]|nr:glycosyltransferase family 9 protein [Candidatus Parcubacteria bacterium]